MRQLILALGIITLSLAFPGEVNAGSKPWVFGWWPGHWKNLDFERPYLYDGKTPHNSQWDHRQWLPGDWTIQRESGLKLIDSWYISGIIRDQYIKQDVPVLEVGSAFYDLGGYDKRRVVQTIDTVYGITGRKKNGIFRIRDGNSGDFIGLYSRRGLMLQ